MSMNKPALDQCLKFEQLLSLIGEDTDHLFDYLSIIKGHIGNASKESETKILEVIKNFEKIRCEGESLLNELQQQKDMAIHVAAQKKQTLESNQSVLKNMEIYQDHREQQILHDVSMIKKTTSEMRKMFYLTDSINDINEQTNLLALNAAVIAAKAGTHGRAFAVVAKELQNLSKKIGDINTEVEQQIRFINTHIEEALEPIMDNARMDKERVFMKTLFSQMEDASHAFNDLGEYFINITSKSFSSVTQINKQVINALSTIQFQDVLRQKLEHAGQGLQDIKDYYEILHEKIANKDTDQWPALDEKIKNLGKKYVMQSQHTVHDGVLGNNVEEDVSPKVELF